MDRVVLPEVIPVFPLTGVLLLPGMVLPLQIFEERYRNMLVDVKSGDGLIGMVQPVVPREDNSPRPGSELEQPELYPVGCVGRVEHVEELKGGRFMIALRGISRFRIASERELHRGYRRVLADYEGFEADHEEVDAPFDAQRLVVAVRDWAKAQGLDVERAEFETLEGITALNGLAMTLPLAPAEKQALLEAESPQVRGDILVGLLRMGIEEERDRGNVIPPTMN